MELGQVLEALPPLTDPNVLVGAGTGDDAAVYRIAPDRALVATVDFFTPIVDDPAAFGAIAAANSLSDVYAMGATPLFALSILAFPRQRLDTGLLGEMVAGGAAKLAEAGVPVVGGHSIDDPEPKFGYAVTGEVHPDRIVTNRGAEPGDLLYLTKPLGSGVVATAIKRGLCPPSLAAAAIAVMSALNREASVAMLKAGATWASAPRSTRARCPSWRASASWRLRTSSPTGPAATTPPWRRWSTGEGCRRPSSCCWPTPRPAAACWQPSRRPLRASSSRPSRPRPGSGW